MATPLANKTELQRDEAILAAIKNSGGGGGGSSVVDFELLLIQDSNGTTGIRREMYKDETVTVTYEKLDGSNWTPVQPVTLVSPALAPNAATAESQTTIINALQSLLSAVKMPTYSSVVGVSVATSTTGATWTVFGSQACAAFDLVNDSGTAIEYRRGGAGVAITIPAGASRLITGITNTNQIGVRRVDQSNTAATVKGEAFSV
ncbi:gp049 [Erwinia phage vB_EamP-S6]|uniref:Gp049 n=1 Tax=Erwinia phage vB_EamP-S6 TaxID=1051675 RepID=G0YQE1_9CAUD|nr:gp049 [Erwinia phage vB_EamP-S6]AEJ81568.1 gp049 [Erwinia phage vB_EamP-S6]